MKTLSVVLGVLFLTVVAGTCFAAPPDAAPPAGSPPGPSGSRGQSGPGQMHGQQGHWFGARHRMASYLGLTQEQIAKMRELRDRFRSETHDVRYDLAIKKTEMRKLFTDPKVDDATLLAKQKEINALRQKLMERAAQLKIEWRKILTAEQIQKLDRIIPAGGFRGRSMGHRMGGTMGRGMGPGGPGMDKNMGPGMGSRGMQ